MTWSTHLGQARRGAAISREELGCRVGKSPESVRAYETGRRKPSRETLVTILDALKLERCSRDEILVGAGYAPDGFSLGPNRYFDYMFTLDQAQDHLGSTPWPAFVLDDGLEIVAANQPIQDLWAVDLRREFVGPFQRNMLAMASNPRFAERVLNWDEMIAVAIAVFKGHHLGPEDLAAPSPFFDQLLGRFAAGDPRYVARFLDLWQKTPPRTPKVRWWYPVVWRAGDAVLGFRGLVTTCDEPHGLAFNDWIPIDSSTLRYIERLGAGGNSGTE